MDTLDHPAVTVATDALAGADRDLVPVSAVVRDDIAAIVIDGSKGRYVVFVHPDGGQWATRGTIFGAPRPAGPRADHTTPHQPIQRFGARFRPGTEGQPGWFAVIGRAACDAVSVSVTSAVEQHVAPIGVDGLVFAVIRAYDTEQPHVSVNTVDGRQVIAAPLAA